MVLANLVHPSTGLQILLLAPIVLGLLLLAGIWWFGFRGKGP